MNLIGGTESRELWVWEFYEYDADSQYIDRLTNNKIFVKFDIKILIIQ